MFLAAALALPVPHARAQSEPAAQSPAVLQPQTEPKPQPESKEPQKGRSRKQRPPQTPVRKPEPAVHDPYDEPRISRVAGPTLQELSLTANMIGGYDDNLTAGLGLGSGSSPTAMASGSTGYLDADLLYRRANTRRSLKVDTLGTLQGYPGYLDQPVAGGVATVDAMARAGHSLTFNASERVGYEPFFSVLSPGASSVPLPPGVSAAAPVTGLYERRSLSSFTSASIGRRWSRSDSTSLSYSYRVQQFASDSYGDTNEHNVQAEYKHRLANGVRARGTYLFVDRDYTDSSGLPLLTRENRIEAGPDIDKVLSRRRHIALSVSAGAVYVESVGSKTRKPFEGWTPTGTFMTTYALSPTSSLEGGYRRDLSELRGVTDELYTTDTAFLNIGGLVTARTDLRVGATYSNWKTFLAPGVNETLNIYGASVRARVMLTRKMSAVADYYYYHHVYSDPTALPAGFPANYDRHAVRVGLMLLVPLAGTPSSYSSSSAPQTPR